MNYLDFLKEYNICGSYTANVMYVECCYYFDCESIIKLNINREVPDYIQPCEEPTNNIIVEYDSIVGVLEQVPEASFVIPLLPTHISWLALILANAKIKFGVRHVLQGSEILRNHCAIYTEAFEKDTDLVYITDIILSDVGKQVLAEIRNKIINGEIKL